MFEGIVGHQKQIEFLTRSMQSGKLAHAFVFAGPAFVGKKTVALKFAQTLLAARPTADNFFHPDYLEISTDEAIKIEQVRDLIYKLSLKPYQARYKVALIDNAETMTVEAQNALLKLLEEPREHTVIILVTSNPNRLLRTISSRAQKINFGLVQAPAYASLLPQHLDAQTQKLVTVVAAGRPGLAQRISNDPEFLVRLQEIDMQYATISANDLVEKLKLAYDLADLETVDLKQVLEIWQIKMETQLVESPNQKLAKNLSSLNQARRYLDQNVNSKLMLTNLMLALN